MANKKYQVFISSTYSDLKEERRKILDILLMADCIPSGMEAFVATDNEQFEVIKKVIDLCDYYVLIIGKRYGSVSSLTGISYTEMEYDYAKSKDIPVLVFAIDESVSLPEEKTELDNEKNILLSKFREKALANRLATIWKTVDELTGALAISIMHAQKENIRPGWQRATDFDEASLRREISDLSKNNKKLSDDLQIAQAQVSSFTEQSDVAFEDCIINLEYHWSNQNNRIHTKQSDEKKIELREIFIVIATEMMDVSIIEDVIRSVIVEKFIGSSYTYFLDDSQIIKTILNQIRALGLIKSYWDEKKAKLYWGLTTKGKKVRDDLILLRKNIK
ncbi:MAG: DUF4062 domain-containing protein [Eubacteriales bacterium]|nr:DUF4062 domain-containing protein [Eubacteriales bacterium]